MCGIMDVVCFFVFKQKTAYEMRISDWSSDVCSSDLAMNSRVDDALGKDVGDAKGGGAFATIKAFLILKTEAEAQDLNYIDPMNKNDRLKVSKALVVEPSSADRVKHARLPAVMRPETRASANDGDYWLIALQKA